jgi:hypothetical protein
MSERAQATAQDPSIFQGMLDAAAVARTAEAHGEGPQSFPLFPDSRLCPNFSPLDRHELASGAKLSP